MFTQAQVVSIPATNGVLHRYEGGREGGRGNALNNFTPLTTNKLKGNTQ